MPILFSPQSSVRRCAVRLWAILGALLIVATSLPAEAAVTISEFVASNENGIRDEDGDTSDWLEIFNSGPTAVALGGWSLTDDPGAPAKWVLPTISIPPNGFLIVWASGKDRTNPAGPLHTKFSLSASGGYLGLFDSNGVAVSAYESYPEQYADRPYGAQQTVATTSLVGPSHALRVLNPTGAFPTTAEWTSQTYNDTGAGWSAGTSGVGYEATVPGFAFKTWFANVSMGSIAAANGVIANPSQQTAAYSATRPVVNYFNSGSEGHYTPSSNPDWLNAEDRNNYVVEATGVITIPTAGVWSFGVNSDDGFELYIDNTRVCFFDGGRGAADTIGSINLTSGSHTVRVMIYEGNGGSSGELFARQGSAVAWDNTFRLVGDTANGGLAVASRPLGSAGSGYLSEVNKNVETTMRNVSSSAYIRYRFSVADPSTLATLSLPIKYDDGFVAYLNGTEVARRNAPAGSPAFNSVATLDRSPVAALLGETVDLTSFRNLIVAGTNTLAIHGLNRSVGDNDFLIRPQLAQYTVTAGPVGFFTTPTPAGFNVASTYNKVSPVVASVPRGFYTAPTSVTLSTPTPGATIRYTFDGSTPSLAAGTSATYSGPLTINKTTTLRYAAFKTGSDSSTSGTQTYLFLSDVINQSPTGQPPVINNPQGASVATTTWPLSPVNSQLLDYGMDPNVVNAAPYSATIIQDLKSLPTLSVVTDLPNLFSTATGIYANPSGDTIQWERPASLELINPDGTTGFQINCGIRIRGGFSRSTDNPKHSFRFFFRDDYGAGSLRYPLFGEGIGVEEFDKIDLRTMQNYSWAFQGDASSGIFVRDVVARDMQLAMGQPGSHGSWYHLYINGQYWGIFNIDERPEASFAASYFGGDTDDYDTIKVAPDSGYTVYATDGNTDAWYTLWDLADLDPAEAGDLGLASTQSGPANDAIYQRMRGNNPDGSRNPAYPVLLDPVNLIDTMLIVLWGGNLDAPTSNFLGNERPNNWFGVRDRTTSSTGFKFVLHDSEHTLRNVNEDRTGPWPAGNSAIQGAGPAFSYSSPQTIWQQLLYSPEFRALAADRIQKHCFNDGVLTPLRATAIYDARIAEISRAVVGESARWGDSKQEPALTRDTHWVSAVNQVRSSFFPGRTNVLLGQLRGDGVFPSIEAPRFNQRGGSVPIGFQVTLTNPNPSGTIYFTVDGSDPRARGGAINSASAAAYAGPITLSSFRNIRARVLSGGVWSALDEATFYVQQDFTKLAVTEIMFNPLASGATVADEFEFLELKNTGSNAIDLSGLSFTTGFTYAFPAGATLAPGAFWVLARNPTEFAKRYPGITVRGTFSGRMDNGGEVLTVSHVLGGNAIVLEYNDNVPWPVAADGFGFSAVNRDPLSSPAPESGEKWRASAQIHGSPGMDDPVALMPIVLVNEVLANPIAPAQDTIELHNPSASAVDISHWWLTDDRNVLKYRIPSGTIIAAGGFLTFTESQFNSSPGAATSFALSSLGEPVYLLSGNAAGQLTGWSHGFQFGASAAGVPFGRYVNSAGDELFPALTSFTPNSQNSAPKVGPIVISEVQFHPPEGYDEFVEIRNITNAAVPLFDPANPANTWRLSGMGLVFPQGVSIPAQSFALVVGIDPAAFRTKYAVPANVQIFGPAPGGLQDSGERLSLERPDAPVLVNNVSVVPYVVVESVRYNDKAPWPPSADGSGPSLQKTTAELFGDDPANWFASGITPGSVNAVNETPTVSLTSPSNNATFTLPTNIVLQATASDPDGSIAKVEFYDGGTKLGEATTAPYSFTWAGAGPGSHTLTARAVDRGLAVGISTPVMVNVSIGPGGNNGIGLRGDYYNNIDLAGSPITRTDATVNLDFSTTFPPVGANRTNVSCRWTGQVLPRTSGTYTFHTNSDDGVRLWVNDQPLVNNWTNHGNTEDVGFIDLVAGQLYDIRMEWFQGGGGAIIQLSWSATGLAKQIIPASQLYPAGAPRIITQPQAVTVEQGANAAFSVVVSGSGNSFQWRRNDLPITGATSQSLALPEVQQGQAGVYSVVITNSGGTATSSNVNLTVTFTDSDGDGLQNSWEIANGLNPNSNADGNLDPDGDGATNRQEFLAGTDPRRGESIMEIDVSPATPTGQNLTFVAQSQRSYTIFYKTDLSSPTWTKLQDIAPAVGVRTVTVLDPYTGPRRFYRLVAPAQ